MKAGRYINLFKSQEKCVSANKAICWHFFFVKLAPATTDALRRINRLSDCNNSRFLKRRQMTKFIIGLLMSSVQAHLNKWRGLKSFENKTIHSLNFKFNRQ